MYDPYNQYRQHQPQLFEDTSSDSAGGYGYNDHGQPGEQDSGRGGLGKRMPQSQNPFTPYAYPSGMPGSQFIQDPFVTNMAMQYGQNLVGQGYEYVDSGIEKIVSVSRVKYYFAVDTRYVLKKLQLLFFPFTHSDWSIHFNHEDKEPVQPRFDINAPDLYIPVMGFITYILIAGLSLGLQNKFSPDILGIQASWAVIWLVLEVGAILLAFYITALPTKMQAFHLLALISYKYVGMIMCLACGILLSSLGYYCALTYCSFSMSVFMFRTLRCQIQGDSESYQDYSLGTKRRFYFLVAISGLQPFMMWWLTRQLVFYYKPISEVLLNGALDPKPKMKFLAIRGI